MMVSNFPSIIKQWLLKTSKMKRPPGPTWFEFNEEGLQAKHYWSLDYPIKLAKKYGDVIYIPAFRQHLILGPTAIEHILKTHKKNYQRNSFFYERRMQPIFGKSLLVTEGNYWKHRRKIAIPAYQQTAIKNYIAVFTSEVESLLTKWQKKNPKKINISTEMNLLTLRIALKIFCNRNFSDEVLKSLGPAIQFCNWYTSNAAFFHPLIPTINQFRFKQNMNKINQFILNIIEERRQNPKDFPDLLHYLIQAKNEETEEPFTTAEVLAEFKTHLVTGHETTACGLSWMWYLLARHPEYREALEAELDRVLNNRLPTLEDIAALPLTKAIILETFRLYPPIWSIARTNIEPDILEGFNIPAGSYFILHLYALHRNPHYWEKPEDFYPERFLAEENTRHPFLFLPFSAGPHTCIASQLAMTEAIIVTAMLAQRIHFNLPSRVKVTPEPCISLRPKGGIKMQPKFR